MDGSRNDIARGKVGDEGIAIGVEQMGAFPAQRLGLEYEERFTGYGDLATRLAAVASRREQPVTWEKTAWRR